MEYFPQMWSGCIAQYPLRKELRTRTAQTELADGSAVKWPDSQAGEVHWSFLARQLDAGEKSAIENLFRTSEGSLKTFTFLDPLANLLRWSEELSETVWHRDALVSLAAGVSDPVGGTGATSVVNAGQAEQELGQTIALPAWFGYCFSFQARSASGTRLRVQRRSGTTIQEASLAVAGEWARCQSAGSIGTLDESMTFSIILAPNSQVDIYGLQVEAGPGASSYMKTSDRSGTYPETRFEHDYLDCVASGPGEFDIRIELASRL